MRKLIKIFPLAILCIGLTSCLKDELITGDTNDAPNILEFRATPSTEQSGEFLYPTYTRTFDYKDEVDYNITISYSGSQNAPSDMDVEVSIDPNVVTKFNSQVIEYARATATAAGDDPEEAALEAQSKLFTLATANLYSLPTNKVTIKKGERSAVLVLKVKSSQIDFDHRYALPLTISSNSGSIISGTFGTALFNIIAKNLYEGNYTAKGVFTHPTAGPRNIDQTKPVTTINATISRMELGDLGTSNYYMYIKVNSDNSVSILPDPSAVAGAQNVRSNGVNKYDPATKTFTLNYKYGTDAAPRVISEVLTLQ